MIKKSETTTDGKDAGNKNAQSDALKTEKKGRTSADANNIVIKPYSPSRTVSENSNVNAPATPGMKNVKK